MNEPNHLKFQSLSEEQVSIFFSYIYKQLASANSKPITLDYLVQHAFTMIMEAQKSEELALTYSALVPQNILTASSYSKEVRNILRTNNINLDFLSELIDSWEDINVVRLYLDKLKAENNNLGNVKANKVLSVSIQDQIKAAMSMGATLTISGMAPYYFKQVQDEKLSYLPEQKLLFDFGQKKVQLSPNIAMVVGCDSLMNLYSIEQEKEVYLLNLAPSEYPEIISATIMASNEKIIVVDSEFGMYVKMEYNQKWNFTVR